MWKRKYYIASVRFRVCRVSLLVEGRAMGVLCVQVCLGGVEFWIVAVLGGGWWSVRGLTWVVFKRIMFLGVW